MRPNGINQPEWQHSVMQSLNPVPVLILFWYNIIFPHSSGVSITISSSNLHNFSISAAIMMCQSRHDHGNVMIPSLSLHFLFPPSVPSCCRSCSLLCCLSSFPPSCNPTPAPPPCSTSRRPTTSQSPSSPRHACTGQPVWFAAHRITPTLSR